MQARTVGRTSGPTTPVSLLLMPRTTQTTWPVPKGAQAGESIPLPLPERSRWHR